MQPSTSISSFIRAEVKLVAFVVFPGRYHLLVTISGRLKVTEDAWKHKYYAFVVYPSHGLGNRTGQSNPYNT